jgi:NADH-quinone oxidoreductase subunit L
MLTALVLLPLVAAGLNGLWGRRLSERVVALIGCGSVGLAMVMAFYLVFARLVPLPPSERVITEPFFHWIESGDFVAAFQFRLDPLSGIYSAFVTFVGFWIHVFAVGYMRGDDGYARFFAYMNLFMFMMLTLVLADNFLMMFVGWEGVGLCSYLLIGHYFRTAYASYAAKKAFIVNRIGDVGFALGIIVVFSTFGTLRFADVAAAVQARFPVAEGLGEVGVVTAIALLLFVGATGKSAQIPLAVWLPDAMAGPTPVSALIHAATMVTAGVYMVARTSEIYARSLTALAVVAVVGCLTAVWAATVALAQTNIKKVLAYSTISQLGYMFLACGVGAFTAAIFHVVTHAFFKALLFLGAGSIIIALHHEEDMRRMGGLKKYLPTTYRTMVFGWLALAGVFPWAGFFSKDEILWRTFTATILPAPWNTLLWAIGFVTAVVTAVYMTRLMVLTFDGEERFRSPHAPATVHESPAVMTIPLRVLALLSLVGGWIGISETYTGGRVANWFDHFLHPAVASVPVAPGEVQAQVSPSGAPMEIGLAALSVMAVVAAVVWARQFYRREPLRPAPTLLEKKYYLDEIYEALVVRPLRVISTTVLWRFLDLTLIDGAVNGTATVVAGMARILRQMQTGLVRSYVVMILVGALIVLGYFVFGGALSP